VSTIDPADLEALYAEKAAQRAAAWAARHTTQQAARARHKAARDAGLRARHARKLARGRATQEQS
jgi:hypothetical protein